MHQPTLHRYFKQWERKPRVRSGLNFFHLHYELRRRIYILAGLVRVCPIDLNLESTNTPAYQKACEKWWYDERFEREPGHNARALNMCFYQVWKFLGGRMTHAYDTKYEIKCICDPLPLSLLYVSRAISHEVTRILYGENTFRISRANTQGLWPLRRMGELAIASLTSLCVILNSRHGAHLHRRLAEDPEEFGFTYEVFSKPDSILGNKSSSDRKILAAWRQAASVLAEHMTPYQLKLCLICDVSDVETAEEVLAPLEHMLLKDCGINLGEDCRHETKLAMSRMISSCSRPSNSSFRFLELPEEIRQHILEFTDLVASKDLVWVAGRGFDHFICCKTCTDTLDSCFCAIWVKSATRSLSCTCWKFPAALFRINHMFYEEARHIFFSKNHFIIDSSQGSWPVARQPAQDLLLFLTSLPASALPHLRSVQWTVGYCFTKEFRNHHEGPSDWLQTVKLMARELDLSKLDLTIDMSTDPSASRCSSGYCSETCKQRSHYTSQVVVEPMISLLNGLRNLFIHLRHPTDPESVVDSLEQELERQVMSGDYDSVARGKITKYHPWAGYYWKHCIHRPREQTDILKWNPVFAPDGSKIWPPKKIYKPFS